MNNVVNENSSRKKYIAKLSAVFLAVMVILTFFSNTINNFSLPRVKTEQPVSSVLVKEASVSGTVCAKETINVYSQSSGNILDVFFKAGDYVKRGDMLILLDKLELEENLKEQLILLKKTKLALEKLIIPPADTILNRLIDDGSTSVYIPADILFDIGKYVSITHIEIKSLYSGTLGKNTEMVSKALQKIGKSPDDYKIMDFNIKKALLKQVPDILIFITFLFVILMLVLLLKREAAEIIKKVMKGSKFDYLSSILRENLFGIIFLSLKIAASIFLAAVLWQLTKFRLYIPSEYIPSDLTDLGYYADLITQSITKSNEYRGYAASYPELFTGAAQNLSDLTFFSGLLLGIPAFYIGLHSIEKTDTLKLVSICGTITLLSVLFLSFISLTLGLETSADLKNTGVVWIFIFISSLFQAFPFEPYKPL